jgi:hypothetical protein
MSESTEYWAVIELMGHVCLPGRVSEVQRFGATLGKVEVPAPDGSFVTHYFNGGSVYRETPCTEEVAREIAANGYTRPSWTWRLGTQAALPEHTYPAPEAPPCGCGPDESCHQCF